MEKIMPTNDDFMRRAIELAQYGTGSVSPNPRVGAVIVKDGKIIGEGWHKNFGGCHAEIEAIANCNEISLEGATLYVNLEPCSHKGKTPPCANAIVSKKFGKVVIGMIDPNPLVCGKGIDIIKEAGIEVETGVLEDECRWINRAFIKFMEKQMPYIIMKAAQSIDGSIATFNGDSKWISCEESRRKVHSLRNEADAILVGSKTALKDNPRLTVRSVFGRNPKRIILNTDLSLPLDIEVFKDEFRYNTIVCCSYKASTTRKAENLRIAGVKILPVETDKNNRLDIKVIFSELAQQFSITSVLVEGGAEIFSYLLVNDFYDELHIFQAPMIIGNGFNAFKNVDTPFIRNAYKLHLKDFEQSGDDLHMIYTKM